jgi:hypothetical protein
VENRKGTNVFDTFQDDGLVLGIDPLVDVICWELTLILEGFEKN